MLFRSGNQSFFSIRTREPKDNMSDLNVVLRGLAVSKPEKRRFVETTYPVNQISDLRVDLQITSVGPNARREPEGYVSLATGHMAGCIPGSHGCRTTREPCIRGTGLRIAYVRE